MGVSWGLWVLGAGCGGGRGLRGVFQGVAGVGEGQGARKRVCGPSSVVLSFQAALCSSFFFFLLFLSLGSRGGLVRCLLLLLISSGLAIRGIGAKKSSSTCQRGVLYSCVGVVARMVSQ